MFETLKAKILKSPMWKARIHWLLIGRGRPRRWVKLLINPWLFRHGKGAMVRKGCILNVSPINDFRIGDGSSLEEYCVVDNGVGDVLIGDNTMVGIRNTLIGPLRIGNHVIIAQNVVFSGLNHSYEDASVPICKQRISKKQIVVEDDCWIGANCVITAGVHIGTHAVIGAGSVVTKNVAPYTVVAGCPARIIKTIDHT